MKITFLIFTLFLLGNIADAQTESIYERLSASGRGGKVTIHQSDNLFNAVSNHVELNKKLKGYPGFRIQIYFGNGNKAKEDAMRTRNKFNEKFPELESYILYQSPYFKVRVGDFTNRYEAYVVFQKISIEFPSAFLVEELITPLK